MSRSSAVFKSNYISCLDLVHDTTNPFSSIPYNQRTQPTAGLLWKGWMSGAPGRTTVSFGKPAGDPSSDSTATTWAAFRLITLTGVSESAGTAEFLAW